MTRRLGVAVLGGGLAGLQLGRRLAERGADFLVLEARDVPGGLCRTVRRGAWSWDIGPHAFYSRRPEPMAFYRGLGIPYHEHDRRVRVAHRVAGRYIEVGYPFENGLADLPLAQKLDCLAGVLKARAFGETPYRNLSHWIANGLGAGIGGLFMTPYNEKIWDCPLERVSMALVKGKIEPEPAWQVVRNAFVKGTVGRAYQARFLYPRAGGAGALTDAVAAGLEPGRLRTGWALARLERLADGWRLCPASGEPVEAGRVVSTIPIPELLKALGREAEAAPFSANHTFMAAVGLRQGRRFGRFGDCHWVFFAGPERFYRLTFMDALGPERPPTVLAEVTRKGGSTERDAPAVLAAVLEDLKEGGIVGDEGDVGLAECSLERYTYPIQTVGLEAAREGLAGRLAAEDIHLLGRSGRWDYVNTDGVFLAVEAFMKGPFAAEAGRRA